MNQNGQYKKGNMLRIIVLHNDGTMKHEVVEAPSYFDLGAEVAAGRIKSFTVTKA